MRPDIAKTKSTGHGSEEGAMTVEMASGALLLHNVSAGCVLDIQPMSQRPPKPNASPSLTPRSQSMSKLAAFVRKYFCESEEGATMVEYGMMLFFLAVVCFSAVQGIGIKVQGFFPSVSASL
jgi:Flp pilus assembly pilin Flp